MGKVKWLELWWRLYRMSPPERDVRNIRSMDFCSNECAQMFKLQYCPQQYGMLIQEWHHGTNPSCFHVNPTAVVSGMLTISKYLKITRFSTASETWVKLTVSLLHLITQFNAGDIEILTQQGNLTYTRPRPISTLLSASANAMFARCLAPRTPVRISGRRLHVYPQSTRAVGPTLHSNTGHCAITSSCQA